MSANMAESLNGADAGTSPQLFVINLCASTSPMALSHPSSPELKRYTFFVSRQREDGRERFRLHMGYFNTQDEAETLLVAVRDVYPAAWAGPAPTSGAPRRGRTATTAAPAMPVAIAAAPIPVPAPVMVAVATPAAVPATVVAKSAVPASAPLESMSNVRDVLAQLSEEPKRAAAAAMPAAKLLQATPPSPATPALQAAPSPPATPPVVVPRLQPAAAAAPAPVETIIAPTLSASQTLRVLEAAAPAAAVDDSAEVRVMTPEDTQTLTDIRIDVQNNAPPCFAVQLIWAVSPIDVATLPHLAIFDAYTLYNVEGNRQGRKWYGLRLGFFSDPNSATQVANYVRADYRAVAVVPVANKEREHARGGAVPDKKAALPRLGEANLPLKPEAQLQLNRENLQGFELLTDDRPVPAKRDLEDSTVGAKPAAKPVAPAAKPAVASRPAAKTTGKRVAVRKRLESGKSTGPAPGASQPLDSTLEILGASTLSLDESREIINDSAVRKPLNRKIVNGNRFSKLLSRLGGN